MKIDFLASERHYFDHLLPVWNALHESERGRFHVRSHLRALSSAAGVTPASVLLSATDGPVCVAGYGDLARVPSGRPAILLEHGVGQTYGDRNPSNPGGTQRRAALFLCPNEVAAAAEREAYPEARVAVIGCPRLDRWHGAGVANPTDPGLEPRQRPNARPALVTVAVSFHWDNRRQAPEARWARPYFDRAVELLAHDLEGWPGAPPCQVIGHGHPRAWRRLRPFYERAGIEPVEDFTEVLERADLYVCDNSSTLYEFASTGRPVLCLDAPWYRRDVEHGLRFWSHMPGLRCGDPAQLPVRVAVALEDPPVARDLREQAVRRAYAFTDGRAAERAVRAIREAFG